MCLVRILYKHLFQFLCVHDVPKPRTILIFLLFFWILTLPSLCGSLSDIFCLPTSFAQFISCLLVRIVPTDDQNTALVCV